MRNRLYICIVERTKGSFMTTPERKKIIEVVLYILNKTGGLDYYRLFKILYFANQRSLVEWGQLMIADKFCALPHGPVPTELYNTIKGKRGILHSSDQDFSVSDYYLLPKREAEMDYLSEYDVDVLDDCISKYGQMSFAELESSSHTACWKKAREKAGSHVIDIADMARDGGANEDLIQYINDSMELDETFGN